jgi:hypothetical protein
LQADENYGPGGAYRFSSATSDAPPTSKAQEKTFLCLQ